MASFGFQHAGPNLPGQNNASLEALKVVRSLLESFDRKNEIKFRMERIVGQGARGVTMKMKMTSGGPNGFSGNVKYFAIKASLDDQGNQNLRQEMRFLRVRIRAKCKINGVSNLSVATSRCLPHSATIRSPRRTHGW